MTCLKNELLALVQDTLAFLKPEKKGADPLPLIVKKADPIVPVMPKKQALEILEKKIEPSLPPPKEIVPEKTHPKKLSLTPLHEIKERSFDEMKKTFFEFHSPHQNPPPKKVTSILILSSTKDAKELEFLENLQNAVTTTIAPTKINFFKDEKEAFSFLETSSFDLFLFAKEELMVFPSFQENLKNAKMHELSWALSSVPFLCLAPLGSYLVDQTLKRSLWNKLKNLPQSLLQSLSKEA